MAFEGFTGLQFDCMNLRGVRFEDRNFPRLYGVFAAVISLMADRPQCGERSFCELIDFEQPFVYAVIDWVGAQMSATIAYQSVT